MVTILASVIAIPAQKVTEYMRVPELFVEPLNRSWIGKNRLVLSVLLEKSDRNQAEWRNLGGYLLEHLLQFGAYIGVCSDGAPGPQSSAIEWLQEIQRSRGSMSGLGTIDLKWITFPHATMPEVTMNSSWCSFQAASDAVWIRSIWKSLTSDSFHFGCDLLLASFAERIIEDNPWDQPLTIQSFLQAIGDAIAWLIPLSSNDGFLIGLPVDADLYRQLCDTMTDA